MDSRQVVALLLLVVTGCGQVEGAEGARSWNGDLLFSEEDSGPQPEQDAETLRSLLHFLLQASKRPSRSPAFLFQPQRFGRNSRGPWSHNRLSARTGVEHSSPFWSLIAPQRFGKK
ncbi:pro-FMRFamide-related neuropeptide FF isoform X2 [Suncus etruscus]|uniref:pro-FMRFamide-related neuropeptide FF isoform X2 n=1 Tax=Suncus etruscus TaxID=109475 RepID=UPI00210FC4A8|nr:pro-FMRFamide-related neuropeptide FF isoform X2 [Suncus etruscus]